MTSSNSTTVAQDFESKKEFFEHLYYMMVSAFETKESGETRGHPRLLKTYIMEANRGLPETNEGTDLIISRKETSLPEISILDLRQTGKELTIRFYVDTTDKRFWLLHTNGLAEDAGELFDKLAFSPNATFDKIWLPRQMIQDIADLPRNSFRGFGLHYRDSARAQQTQQATSTSRYQRPCSLVRGKSVWTEMKSWKRAYPKTRRTQQSI